jgi:hypothetical protein
MQFGDALFDLAGSAFEQVDPMRAGGLAALSQGHDLADLSEG